MDPTTHTDEDLDEARAYSLERYNGESRVEGTVADMLDNLKD